MSKSRGGSGWGPRPLDLRAGVQRGGRWLPLAGLIVLATVLRLWALTGIPPGLYHDEAFNGLDALSVLEGNRPVYFEANIGREPFFIYAISISVALLGRSPGAIRMAAVALGVLTVPAVYLMALEMGGRRLAALAATFTATTVWHLALSRVGLRALSLPLVIALALWLLWRGWKRGQRWLLILAGLCFGAAPYTYLAARFTYIALLGFGIIVYRLNIAISFNDEKTGRPVTVRPKDALSLSLAAILVLLPLLIYGIGHWDIFMGRADQVSIFNPSINKGDLWGTLIRHTGRALGMFFVRGDFIPRHNVPLRPVFDPLVGAAFLLGLVRALREWRRPDRALVLVWLAVMIVPTIVAEDAPHFLRAVGLQPVLFLVPALGLEAAWQWLEKHASQAAAGGLVILTLLASLGLTVRDYFFRYGTDPELRYSFETAAVEMAVEVNRFLGTGWPGEGLAARGDVPQRGRRVYLDERLWRDWRSVQFLVPESPALHLLDNDGSPAASAEGAQEVLLVLWPYDDYRPWLDVLAPRREIRVREGSLERGDLEETAYPLYLAVRAGPVPLSNVRARLQGGQELVEYQLGVVDGGRLQVTLRWRATEPVLADYPAFVQLLQDGQLVAQHDVPPGTRYLPTRYWRAGDVIVDEHSLELDELYEADRPGQQLIAGLYESPSLIRLSVLDENGQPGSDHIPLH
ncbi:MAG: glycosyltransferase family 39 protein [Anaerolineae bacterium]|nr:MAG: glycosyltransferase family 39 protein [Anaerolineae bacterium]